MRDLAKRDMMAQEKDAAGEWTASCVGYSDYAIRGIDGAMYVPTCS